MPAPIVDDIDYSDIEEKYKVHYDESFDTTLVVDGIPIIDESKRDRLLTKFCKEFARKGVSIRNEDVFMPWDEAKGKSKGYAFVDFRTVDDANLALASLHNHPFDSKHTFKLNRFTDVEDFGNLDESYVEPEYEEFKAKVCISFLF
ncbi:hypothetical protein H0H93_015730 [Arthromyces matolae]|nr:hypothetical protein H0H93_015730 [Arthromyces matolae]